MDFQIHANAIKILRNTENPSFLIIELANNLVVDFAKTEDEALNKCMIAMSYGSICKFYESSVNTIEIIREATKNVDVDHDKKGIRISDLGFNISND